MCLCFMLDFRNDSALKFDVVLIYLKKRMWGVGGEPGIYCERGLFLIVSDI